MKIEAPRSRPFAFPYMLFSKGCLDSLPHSAGDGTAFYPSGLSTLCSPLYAVFRTGFRGRKYFCCCCNILPGAGILHYGRQGLAKMPRGDGEMALSARTRSRIIGYIDYFSALGLKIGIAALILTGGFLLLWLFGGHAREMSSMAADKLASTKEVIDQVVRWMIWSFAVVVVSAILRTFNDEVLGQVLAVAGVMLYFGAPVAVGQYAGQQGHYEQWMLAKLAVGLRACGLVAMLPGLVLVVRDGILRIWTGMSVKRVLDRRWGDEEERRKKFTKPKPYGKCWDMPFCREFVRRVCPAFEAKKACWRVKTGCYCDERTILKAMTSSGKHNDHLNEIMHTLGLDQGQTSKLSGAAKRARCRRCMIYAEHQRQKYRILSPVTFPVVFLVIYAYYGKLVNWLLVWLGKADRFMSMLTYSSHDTFAQQGPFLAKIFVVWVTIVALSYALKFVEYLVFELQV